MKVIKNKIATREKIIDTNPDTAIFFSIHKVNAFVLIVLLY
jgi:hypothetical protein